MKLCWAALSAVLALSVLKPSSSAAQTATQPPAARRVGSLGQNYPNPFNPETTIPFTVDRDCERSHQVTIRIYNLLAQVVAVPVFMSGGTGSVEGGQPVENITLGCGDYRARWDGKYLNSGREAASGVYLYRLEIDGRVEGVRRFLVTK